MIRHDPERLLRRMVLSGRTILCAGEGYTLGKAEEMLLATAIRAGRSGDVARVHPGATPPPWCLTQLHRRPCLPDVAAWYGMPETKGIREWRPGIDPGPSHPNPPRAPDWMDKRHRLRPPDGIPLSGADALALLGDPDGPFVDPRPEHDPGPALRGGGIVLVDAATPAGLRYLHWLAYACIEAAERDGRPVPLLLAPGRQLTDLATVLGWTETATPDAYVVHPKADVTACARDYRDERDWSALLARREAAATASRADDVWSVHGEGRALHVIRVGCFGSFDPRHPEREMVLFAAVSPAGFLTAHQLPLHRRVPDEDMAGLAMDAWLGGAFSAAHDDARGPSTSWRGIVALLQGEHVPTRAATALLGILGGELGPDGLAFMAAVNDHGHEGALQLWAGTGGRAILERRQFVRSHPALANLALDPEVTRCVDARISPLPRMCALTGAPRAAVSRYGALRRPYWRMGKPEEWGRGGLILSALGHGHLPPDGAYVHWFALYDLLTSMTALNRGNLSFNLAPLTRLACRIPGRTWPARRSWLGAIGDDAIRGAGDMLHGLRAWLAAVVGGGAEIPDAYALAESYGTVRRLLDASHAWHRDPMLRASRGPLPPDLTWPVPFEALALSQDGFAVGIGSMVELEAEGWSGPDARGNAGLTHCVAGYGEQCAQGRSLIVSLRAGAPADDRYRRLSTLELCPNPGGDWLIGGRPYAVRQHRGNRNADPPWEALILEALLRQCLRDGHPVDVSALDLRPDAVRLARPTDMRDLFPRWAPVLPPHLRGTDLDGLAAALGAGPERAIEDEAA